MNKIALERYLEGRSETAPVVDNIGPQLVGERRKKEVREGVVANESCTSHLLRKEPF